MFPNMKPSSAVKNERDQRTNEQLSSVRPPERAAVANMDHTPNNYWAGNAGQLGYSPSTEFRYDPSMYRTALTPSRSWSISPIKRSDRPTSTSQTAGPQTYPSQELNPRYAGLHLSPPNSDGSWSLPPLAPPLHYPNTDIYARRAHVEELISMATPYEPSHETARNIHVEEVPSSMATGFIEYIEELDNPLIVKSRGVHEVETVVNAHSPNIDVFARRIRVEELISMATPYEPSHETARNIHVEEVVSSMATGFKEYIEELDNPLNVKSRGVHEVETVVNANVSAAQPKSVHFDLNDNVSCGSTIPTKEKHQASRAAKTTKCSAKTTPGIERPNELDILRGRGGMTNRHKGNMRFRDEARKLRARYRHENTKREEKFILSEVLVKRVKEYGGRFLELGVDQLWHEMDKHGARKKASQGMNLCPRVSMFAL
jgi:hypothetical protein